MNKAGWIYCTLAAFFIMAGYEIIRSVSQSLYIRDFGAAALPWVIATGPLAVALATYGYSRFLEFAGPKRTFYASLAAALAVSVALYSTLEFAQWKASSFLLYVFRETYIVLVVAQIWSLVNSSIKVESARLLNGPLIGLSSLGATAGGWFTHKTAEILGSSRLLPFHAGTLVLASFFLVLAFRHLREPANERPKTRRSFAELLALPVLRKEITVRRLAVMVALGQMVSVSLELIFSTVLETSIPDTDARSAFLGQCWAILNFSLLFMTFVVVPMLLHKLALKWIHFFIPVIHLGTTIFFLFRRDLGSAAAAFFVFKGMDYSLFGAAKETAYVPLSFEARYRAKAMIDAFTYRTSKGIAAGAMGLGQWVVNPTFLTLQILPFSILAALMIWARNGLGIDRVQETPHQ